MKATTTNLEYDYDFSVVMAVYNVEEFLSEAIESLLKQDIGFERIQLILVDDGSTDSSGSICDKYAQQFPTNILAVHKENGGVAAARNEGLKHVSGRYINFMDSDDKFSPEAFRKVFDFLQNNSCVDIATIPLYYFDAFAGEHWQNGKFAQGTRVIDLMEEYTATIMFVNSSFFRHETKDVINFDDRLVCGEDQKVLFEVLSKTMKLGVVTGCYYYYRRRSSGEASLIGSKEYKYGWYFDYFTYLFDWACSFFTQKFSTVPPFVQYQLMCDLQWRFKENYSEQMNTVLNSSEIDLYKERLFKSLSCIEDKYINEMKMLPPEFKLYALQKKHGTKPSIAKDSEGGLSLFYGKERILSLSRQACFLDFIDITSDSKLEIEGHFLLAGFTENDPEFALDSNGKFIDCIVFPRPEHNKYCFDEIILKGYGFKGSISLNANNKNRVKFVQTVQNELIEKKRLRFLHHSPISGKFKHEYFSKNNYIVARKGNVINITSHNLRRIVSREKNFIKEIKASGNKSYATALSIRKKAFLNSLFSKNRKTWIISDRINAAGDNGEALFEYLCANPIKNVDVYFAINKNTTDYERLKKIGPVIDLNSSNYKNMLTKADLLISSQIEKAFLNPFGASYDIVRSLLKFKLVFLQHGITKDDLSSWINRYKANISLFVTSARKEHLSIVGNPQYYYSSEVVKRLGMPRHDKLLNNNTKPSSTKRVLIAPTWRANLVTNTDPATGLKAPRNDFENSLYFNFYNKLINNKDIQQAAAKYGYEIDFLLHPCMVQESTKFKSEFVNILTKGNYSELFQNSDIMLTDFSSVAFDFAILKKPIIYAQFDQDSFFEGQIYNHGYYDYENEGFGPVCLDLETAIEELVGYMKNPVLNQKYLERINDFYSFPIEGSNERIANALQSL